MTTQPTPERTVDERIIGRFGNDYDPVCYSIDEIIEEIELILQTERQRCNEVVEAEREEIRNRLYQLIDGSPGQVYLLPHEATKVVGYIYEEGMGDVAYKGKAINLKVIVDEALTPPNNM